MYLLKERPDFALLFNSSQLRHLAHRPLVLIRGDDGHIDPIGHDVPLVVLPIPREDLLDLCLHKLIISQGGDQASSGVWRYLVIVTWERRYGVLIELPPLG